MKFEIKLFGSENLSLIFDDHDGKLQVYEVTMIKKKQKGAKIVIGKIDKSDLKRLAKAS